MKKTLSLLCVLLLHTLSLYGQNVTTQIWHTQDRSSLKKELMRQVEEAKESILIFTFTCSDPDFIALLEKKRKEGLDVCVVIDKDHMQPVLSKQHLGLEVVTRSSGEGRVHHKIAVLDTRRIWIGSLNFTESAYKQQENVMLSFDSPELAAFLEHEKNVFLNKAVRDDQMSREFIVDGMPLYFGLLPHDGYPAKKTESIINKESKKVLLNAIRSAESRLQIAMMVWTDPEISEAVCQAYARGVVVEVLSQDFGGEIARLKNIGIDVRINPKFSLMHNKFLIVDATTFINGSANWSKSSFTRNDESFVVLYDLTPELQNCLQEYWRYLWPE